jgi:hypothetical protein
VPGSRNFKSSDQIQQLNVCFADPYTSRSNFSSEAKNQIKDIRRGFDSSPDIWDGKRARYLFPKCPVPAAITALISPTNVSQAVLFRSVASNSGFDALAMEK